MIGPELPSPAILLLSRPVRGLISMFSRPPMLYDNDEITKVLLLEESQLKMMIQVLIKILLVWL